MGLSILAGLLPNFNGIELAFFVVIAAITGIIISTAIQWSRLSHVPGPFLASLTSLWLYRAVAGLNFHRVTKEVQEKYGKIVRIAPNDVMISDPEELWRISSARSLYARGDWYGSMRFNPYGHTVLSEMDTVKHDKRKAKLQSGFSGRGIMDIEGIVDIQIGILIQVLKNRIEQGQESAVVDLGRMLQNFQVDLITQAGMGKAWGNLTTGKDHFGYLDEGDRLFPRVHSIAMVPLMRSIFFSSPFLRLFGVSNTTGWLGALGDVVKQRVKSGKEVEHGSDMLSEWLKHGLSPAEAELDLSLQVPAGTETSISTIRGILMYLMTSPNIYRKLKNEIRDGIQDGHISSPVKSEEAKKLPYLQAVMLEGMRMVPALVAGLPKKVPVGGDVVSGKSLPAGTEVHVNLIALMRDRDVFGHDIDIFRPERFIECDEATSAKRRKVMDLIFGHGRWLCLGRVMALIEINKILVELLRSFDFQVGDPENPWRRTSTTSFYIKDFFVRVTEDTTF